MPRHIRDGEHDSWEDTMAGMPTVGGSKPRLVTMLIGVAVALAAGFGVWLALS